MREKLLNKRAEAVADIELYEELLAKAKAKVDILDEMLEELADEDKATEEMPADPVEITTSGLL